MDQDQVRRLGDLSLEVTSRSRHAVELCRQHLRPGTHVYIAFIPGDAYHASVETARALALAGFVAVPHIAARSLASYTQLHDYLARLAGEAGVARVLVIGGDPDPPAGPYDSALALLETGQLPAQGIAEVGFACHPEGHPKVPADVMDRALEAKLALAAEQGLDCWLVSQFCFAAGPILACLRTLRARGITAPVRIGLAGPAERRVLLKYAVHCGIGNSIRALGSRFDAVRNLLAQKAPDDIVAALAGAAAKEPDLGIQGLHLFPFGNITAAARWGNALVERRPARA